MDIHNILKIVCILLSFLILALSISELICVIGGKALAKMIEKMIIRALKEEGKEPTTENIEAYIDKILKEIEEKKGELK